MSVIRTVFLGTPDIARHCLEALLKDSHYKVVGVVSQPDRPAGRKMVLAPSPVKQLALTHQLPVLTPERVSDPAALTSIQNWGAEVAVVVAFGQILPQAFLDLYPRQVVNVHASILPRWRGAAPIQRSVMAGETQTGVCLQVMVKKLDAGDVIGVRHLKVTEAMTAVEVHEQMKPLAADLLAVDLMDYLRGNLVPVPQDESLVTYAHKISKAESLIDWRRPAVEIFNQMRGMALGPGVYTTLKGKKLKIHGAQVVPGQRQNHPGEVIKVDADSFIVASGGEALRVLSVQPESRAQMTVQEFLRGYPLQSGERLGE
ncbi:MAG: methionyl-tRNA formyltransferase [Bdellovibrionales bacterium]|nr:methionyl-tRNA formyltransferase [Bdellovibrionales bacterium]